jgi:hypothetical protein
VADTIRLRRLGCKELGGGSGGQTAVLVEQLPDGASEAAVTRQPFADQRHQRIYLERQLLPANALRPRKYGSQQQ